MQIKKAIKLNPKNHSENTCRYIRYGNIYENPSKIAKWRREIK
jgi:hypothetical protein